LGRRVRRVSSGRRQLGQVREARNYRTAEPPRLGGVTGNSRSEVGLRPRRKCVWRGQLFTLRHDGRVGGGACGRLCLGEQDFDGLRLGSCSDFRGRASARCWQRAGLTVAGWCEEKIRPRAQPSGWGSPRSVHPGLFAPAFRTVIPPCRLPLSRPTNRPLELIDAARQEATPFAAVRPEVARSIAGLNHLSPKRR